MGKEAFVYRFSKILRIVPGVTSMLLTDHQQSSKDPLLSGLVCVCVCCSFQIGCSRIPLGCSSCHQRHQLFSAVPQLLLTHTLLDACGLAVLIPYLLTTVYTQMWNPSLTQHPMYTFSAGSLLLP